MVKARLNPASRRVTTDINLSALMAAKRISMKLEHRAAIIADILANLRRANDLLSSLDTHREAGD